MSPDSYSTNDVHFAAALTTLLGTPPTYQFERDQVLLSFPQSKRLCQAIEAYFQGKPINALQLILTIKALEREIDTQQQRCRQATHSLNR